MRFFLGIVPLLLAVVWCGSAKAHGSFLVNTTADVNDGGCEDIPAGDCSLREAIIAANALVNDHPDAPDTIAFDFRSDSEPPFTIALESPLPAITEGVILNGGSEPHYIVAREHVPVIVIDGGGFDQVLEVRSDSTLIIALAFTNAAVSAIDAEGADYLLVQGCYFGIDPSSRAALHPNPGESAFGFHAIHVRDAFRARIGGQGELSRNVIGGAGAEAILVERSDGLLLHGNYVGVDPSGLEARANAIADAAAFAVEVRESESIEIWDNVLAANLGGGLRLRDVPGAAIERNIIGLDATGRAGLGNASTGLLLGGELSDLRIVDNWVSANGGPGIVCSAQSSGPWRMERNFIGVDSAQSDVLPNIGHGVSIESGCTGAIVGSEEPSDGNMIVHNEGAGVRSADGRAAILGNVIFRNEGLAIDTGTSGRVGNDAIASALPLKYPDGLELWLEGENLVVRACVPPGSRVEVFEALLGVEGRVGALRPLGAGVEGGEEDRDASTTCSASNDAAFEWLLPNEASIDALVLTATHAGHTSELSDPVSLIDEPLPTEHCGGASDCEAATPICDPVFLRCVECLDDALDDAVDAGCASETPRCVGDYTGRRCEPAKETVGPPRELPSPNASGGCSVTPEGDASLTRGLWLLIAFAVFRKTRSHSRSIT